MMTLNTTIDTYMDIKNLRETLQKMNYGELIESFMEYAEKDITFANEFRLFVTNKLRDGGEEEARTAVNRTFAAIGASSGRNKYYDSMDWYNIMNDKDILFQDAEHAFEFGNFRRAVAYPLQWLKRFNEEFTEDAFDYDDEGIQFEWACDEAMKFIEKVMYNAEADSRLKEDVCKELLAFSDASNVFEKYGFADMKTFAQRMKALTESPEEALVTIEDLINRAERTAEIKNLILQKYNLLSGMGKGSEALDFLEDNISKDAICSYLVDTLMDKKDYERALSVLEKALKLGDRFLFSRWMKKKIEIYEILGDKKQVIAVYRRLFIQSAGSLKIYATLKSMIPVNEWKTYLSAMMDETHFSDFCWGEGGNTKAEIFLAENDMDSLFQYMMRSKYDLLNLYSHYAIKLSPEQQTELIPNYVEEIRSEAAIAKKRDHYISVCHYISHLRELYGATEVVNELLTEFLETYRRRPAFIAELKKLM